MSIHDEPTDDQAPDSQPEIHGQPDVTYDDKPKRDYGDYGDYGAGQLPLPGDVRKAKQGEKPRRGRRWACLLLVGCMFGPCICCGIMFCCLGVSAGVVSAIFDDNKVTVTQTDSFDVEPGTAVTLNVDNRTGDVTVQSGSSDQIVVKYTITAYGITKSAAEEALDDVAVDIDQPNDASLNVSVDPGSGDASWLFRPRKVKIEIEVPDEVYLTINNNVGTIDINNVTVRSMNVTTDVGEIRFDGDLAAGAESRLWVETNVGSVKFVLPDDVYVELEAMADVGEVTVSDGFDNVKVESSGSSDSSLEQWQGTLGSGDGDPPMLTLRANVGSVDVTTR